MEEVNQEDLTKTPEHVVKMEEIPAKDLTRTIEAPEVEVKEVTEDNPVLNPTTGAKQEISQEKK